MIKFVQKSKETGKKKEYGYRKNLLNIMSRYLNKRQTKNSNYQPDYYRNSAC